MCVLQVAHQLLGDTDDCLSVRYGPDLAQGFGVEREAPESRTGHRRFPTAWESCRLACPCRGTLAALVVLPSTDLPDFARTLDSMLTQPETTVKGTLRILSVLGRGSGGLGTPGPSWGRCGPQRGASGKWRSP